MQNIPMWQKLASIDPLLLTKARIQITNALQLVAAAPRAYADERSSEHIFWHPETSACVSRQFGANHDIRMVLDIPQFVLTLEGKASHKEHLVLSGITYPMAFGWVKIKLDAFSLDADLYDDRTDYTLEHALGSDEELSVTDQKVFENIAMYMSNAQLMLETISTELESTGLLAINPSNMNLRFHTSDKALELGFSLGDPMYPEPYFYILISDQIVSRKLDKGGFSGIYNNKSWHGVVLLATEFLSLNPEDEASNVSNFFSTNISYLLENK